MRGAKRQCCCVPVARVQQRPEWNVDIPPADGGVPQARSHLAFMRGGAAPSAACPFTMKAMKEKVACQNTAWRHVRLQREKQRLEAS